MTRREHLLIILAEECAEVAQRVSKALRFGDEEIEPAQGVSNSDRIFLEMADLLAVYDMLRAEKALPQLHVGSFNRRMEEKRLKVEKYLVYSEKCGTLAEDRT